MITYLKTTRAEIKAQFKNAAAKCFKSEIKPKVRMIAAGKMYLVTGNTGNQYRVAFVRETDGRKRVMCDCPTADGILCYHAAAAYILHLICKSNQTN